MADTPGAGPSRRVRPTAADYLTDDDEEDEIEDEDEPMNVDPEPMDVDHNVHAPDALQAADGGQPPHPAPDQGQTKPAPVKHKKYHRRPDEKAEILEHEDLRLEGEEDAEGDDLPLRILTRFVVVEEDSKRMRPLDPASNKRLQVIGYAVRALEPDEDAGQEDEGFVDDEAPDGLRIRTALLLKTSCDYLKAANPEIEIKTAHARYILRSPDEQYRDIFAERERLVRLTALLLSLGNDPMNAPEAMSLEEFKEKAGDVIWDGRTCTNKQIKSAAYQVQKLLPRLEVTEEIRTAIAKHPIVVEALQLIHNVSIGWHDSPPYEYRRLQPPRPAKLSLSYDPNDPDDPSRRKIDKDVMKPQNQTQNTVTPRMARLAKGWTAERLRLLGGEMGPRRRPWDKAQYRQDLEAAIQCARKAPRDRRLVNIDGSRLVPDRKLSTKWKQTFQLHGVNYDVGDTILCPITGKDLLTEPADNARMEDYFCFGKILYVNLKDSESAHVLWYEHSSHTALGLPPASDERELMLTSRCEDVWVREFCGTVDVLSPDAGLELEDGIVPDQIDAHYYCRFSYDRTRPSFTDVTPLPELEAHATDPRGCPTCLREEEETAQDEQRLTEYNNMATLTYKGEKFHKGDCILFAGGVEGEIPGPSGVGSLGRIVSLRRTDRGPIVTVAQLVRQSCYEFDDASLGDLDVDAVRDPRQLLSTTHEIDVPATRIVRKIYIQRVAHSRFIWMPAMKDVKQWLDASPDHFIVKYHWNSLTSSADGTPKLRWYGDKIFVEELHQDQWHAMLCKPCRKAKRHDYKMRQKFAERRGPIKILDLCSGTGAFSLGIAEGMGCKAEVRYAVEISPSAMTSFKQFHPQTTTFNTCINTFLDYTIKYNNNMLDPTEEWKNLDGTDFAAPPSPGEIDCIVVGLPCQPHSYMNRYKHDDDAKSNLVFTVLSIIEHLQPKHIIFENVRGIMSFALSPTTNVVPEGLKHTGLNFLCACLAALGYQFSFQLMNAAAYGTPQHRVRWFLVAAKVGEPLPKFPIPTHFYPDAGKDASSLGLKVHPGSKNPTKPVKPEKGAYLYPHVTIREAIEDLWTFDMTNPGTLARQYSIPLPSEASLDREIQRLRTHRRRTDWNPGGDDYDSMYLCCPEDEYLIQPLNRLQLEARVNVKKRLTAQELQHYTRYLGEEVSEFICNIPMNEKAKRNYLGLPNGFQSRSRMLHDASSSNARHGHKGNYFARADKDGVFQTTVTNIGPAAKQSRCLHPWAYRVFTIRELARSQGFPDEYQFIALDDDIVTMHRQIGNAVPWPIGRALGREYGEVLFKQWCQEKQQVI